MKKQLLYSIICCFSLGFTNAQSVTFFKDYSNITSGTSIVTDSVSYYLANQILRVGANVSGRDDLVFSKVDKFGNFYFSKTYINDTYSTYFISLSNIQKKNYGITIKELDTINYSWDSSSVNLIKFNDYGDTIFTKTLLYEKNSSFLASRQSITKNEQIIITGITNSKNFNKYVYDVFILSIDTTGSTNWIKYIITPTDELGPYLIKSNENKGFFLSYNKNLNGNELHGFIAKLDSLGNVLLDFPVTQPGAIVSAGTITSVSSSSYILLNTYKDPTEYDPANILISKMNNNGTILWQKKLNYPGYNSIYKTLKTNDINVVSVGIYTTPYSTNGTSVWISKMDTLGNVIWNRIYSKYGDNNYNEPYDFIQANDNGFIITGSLSDVSVPTQNMFLLKLDSMGCDTPGCRNVSIKKYEDEMPVFMNIFPNPSIDKTTITIFLDKKEVGKNKLEIYTLTGKKINEYPLSAYENSVTIENLPTGIYIAAIVSDDGKIKSQQKFIKSN